MKERSVEQILDFYKKIVVPSSVGEENIQNIINFQEIGRCFGERSYFINHSEYGSTKLVKVCKDDVKENLSKIAPYQYRINHAANCLDKIDELKDVVSFQTISAFKAGSLFSDKNFNRIMNRSNITEQDRIIHFINQLTTLALYVEASALTDDVKEKIIKSDQYIDKKLSGLKKVANSDYGYDLNYDSEILPALINKFIFTYKQNKMTCDYKIDESQVEKTLQLI